VVERGPVRGVFDAPAHPATQRLLTRLATPLYRERRFR
jgi:ABC-type dipeptide/oligopeptide/nickel transport system ATPase component